MHTLSTGIDYLDLNFSEQPGIIAVGVLHGTSGVAIVDPGPTSTLPTLWTALAGAGITPRDVTSLVLTHIHLDHAGSTGTLVAAHPALKVYVHERGAPHLVNPEKLVASASRLYGDDMDRLWGEVLPVPEDRLVVLSGGDRIEAGGRQLHVSYTPGHASHHVSYFCADAGVAFVGDTAGVRLGTRGFVMPPTPPPDIDLELWRTSLAVIRRWAPSTMLVSHFGPSTEVDTHLDELDAHLELVAQLVRTSLQREGTDEARESWFVDEVRRELRRRVGDEAARAYETAGRFDLNWRGLARYWRKKTA
jgi:glyoxylase-like metal-dependent hydrolase (beta-lactamase superfamily II)